MTSLRTRLLLFAAIILRLAGLAHAQIEVAAVARLHFRAATDSLNWFEGFARPVAGTNAPYASHRSAEAPAPALVARTQGRDSAIVWQTATLPAGWRATTATFVWVCGLGSNLGEGQFELRLNRRRVLVFSTPKQPAWEMIGEGGATLAFTAVFQNHHRAHFGYMTLTMPAAWLQPGRSATITITGRQSPQEIWYRTFAYPDALTHLRTQEFQEVFADLEVWHLGEAKLAAYAPAAWAGRVLAVYGEDQLIGRQAFEAENDLAAARMAIPRALQNAGEIKLRVEERVVATVDLRELAGRRLQAFLEEELRAERYVFPPGALPAIAWKRPAMVDNELGPFELRVRYFNRAMQQVTAAAAPGRYAAVVEGATPQGFTIKRFLTLFCAPLELDDYSREASIRINPLPALGLAPTLWQRYAREWRVFSFGDMIHYLHTSADAAIFLAGLAEMDSISGNFDSPRLRDRQWWIEFKRKQENLAQLPVLFQPPQPRPASKAPELLAAGGESAVFTPSALQKIRAVCENWAAAAEEPLTALVVHRGQIVFHEAFGRLPDGTAMTTATPTWMASITKLLTGVLLMQFVDQGLLDLEAPVQEYLPEIKTGGATALTLRHLFTHTHGGAWHGEWASDWNPALENQVAQALPLFEVGRRFQYNRLGYALAGKVMERLSGRAVPYLFEVCLFAPLGMQQAVADNTYGGLYATCLDLAKLGQMLLQRGRYGAYEFFSEENFRKLLPAPLAALNPALQQSWGIGTAPAAGNGLSEQAFGHAAASGAIFQVDPQQELILIVGRDRTGASYDHHAAAFVAACTAPLPSAARRQ